MLFCIGDGQCVILTFFLSNRYYHPAKASTTASCEMIGSISRKIFIVALRVSIRNCKITTIVATRVQYTRSKCPQETIQI